MKNVKIVELTEEDFYGAYEVFKVTVPYENGLPAYLPVGHLLDQ